MAHHLAEFDSDATDEIIAAAIAGYLLNIQPAGPFKLAYKFDANSAPPPVKCDRIVQAHTMCAIERKDKEQCRKWLLEVLKAGLYVQRFTGKGYFTPVAGGSVKDARDSIAARLRMADFDAKRTTPNGYLDDDESEIPF
jgi:hypothetical protein